MSIENHYTFWSFLQFLSSTPLTFYYKNLTFAWWELFQDIYEAIIKDTFALTQLSVYFSFAIKKKATDFCNKTIETLGTSNPSMIE